MNKLEVEKNNFIYCGKTFQIEDIYSEDFYHYSNENAKYYKTDLYIANELFYTKFQKALAIKHFILTNNIDCIEVRDADKSIYSMIVDIAKNQDINLIENKSKYNLFYNIAHKSYSYVLVFAYFFYLVFKMLSIPFESELEGKETKFAIIRTLTSKKRMAFLDDVVIRYEQLTKKDSIYTLFSYTTRLRWAYKAFRNSFSELKKYEEYVKKKLGLSSACEVRMSYSIMITRTLLYRYLLDEYFKKNEGGTFYTGNCVDRFAMIEAELAKKYKIKIICIPHGIELGFLFPCGYPCDLHYSTTLMAKDFMNNLYNTDKFVYDEKIAKNMLGVYSEKSDRKRVVFFTESREVHVNVKIIIDLIRLLKNKEIILYLKLHPNDRKSYYLKFDKSILYIDNFNVAITNNICIARKSTILVEALYNGSIPLAILSNQKDIATLSIIPSLQDSKIKRFYSVKEMVEYILKII